MRTLIEAWKSQADYFDLTASLMQRRPAAFTGLPLLPRAALAASLFQDLPFPMLVLTATEEEAIAFSDNLRPFLGEQARHFPVLELLPFEVYARNIELIEARVSTLSALARGEKLLVVACVNAITRRLAPPPVFLRHHLTLRPGDVIQPGNLAARLADMGYERTPLTEIPGAFSLRGSIVDLFPINGGQPLRVEFFDDEIDSIRYFDPAEQRSQDQAQQVLIPPARELPWNEQARRRAATALRAEYDRAWAALHGPARKNLEKTYAPLLEYLPQAVWDNGMESLTCYFYPEAGSLFDYLGDGLVLLSEPDSIRRESEEAAKERELRYFDLLEGGRLLSSFYYNFLAYEDLHQAFASRRLLMLCQLNLSAGFVEPQLDRQFMARELPPYASQPARFIEDINAFVRSHYRLLLTASSPVRVQRIREILQENNCPPVDVVQAGFTVGFESPQLKCAVITENEIFSRQARKRRRHIHKGGDKINSFIDLKAGDYVVHINQGVGQYLGVERLSIGDNERDYLLIRYAGEDKLYLPVDQLDLIQKYVGSDSGAPKLYRLGGGEWGRVKARVRAAVREMAEGLLQLYAEREKTQGFAFSPDSPWQQEFEDAFPYTETTDQLTAAEEIKEDMESPKVMDRLLCGDVGYGKTEIAMRAIFKAVQDSKQAAILVPTTVLAQQHYRTMCQRFQGYPVSCGCLSRFVSPKEQKRQLERLAKGELDVLVGTHRLLSQDVKFKDLGLLVVDEEQRFGVSHKEKIKRLRTQVDVLTLSATPIPRTLHMALVGMRDMSIISTPPESRIPVQTYVVEYHQRMIRDAIARELGRGGQVYFVHNRVFNIYEVAEELRRLLPQARILVGHGQRKEHELEQVMLDFVAHEADVLVCTTIIESGLDIPNVNTLIVNEADMYGLAQLYQLRGRVGRSERQGFAYFTFRKDREINELAKKRLIAIRDFTELGSGFKIAMRDLELRGAGNILGPEQHGHIAAVGFDLYCKLLEEEMSKAKGEESTLPQVSTQIDLDINAYIPDSFVPDAVLKVELYRRLAACQTQEEIQELSAELSDRYGQLPAQVENLLDIGRMRVPCRRLAVETVKQKPGGVLELRFAEGHPVQGRHLINLMVRWEKRLVFSDKKGFSIMLKTKDLRSDAAREALLLRVLTELEHEVYKDKAPA